MVRIMQERFLHSIEVFVFDLCCYTPFQHIWKVLKTKKNSKFIVARSQKSGAPRYRAVGGQTHAGEVSKFKFRYLSLICAVLHLSSISGRYSTQKNSKFIEGRSKKKRRNKMQGCRGQNHAGEVYKLKFRCLSLICAVLHLSSISGRSSKQKKLEICQGSCYDHDHLWRPFGRLILCRSVRNTEYESGDFVRRLAHCIHISAQQ